MRAHPDIANTIEVKIREQSGVVANSMLAAPEEGEEAEAAD